MTSCLKRRAAADSPSFIWRRSLRCEPLESRHLLATLVSPWMVWYQDQDGDLVQVRLTQPLLSPANVNDVFRFAEGNVNGSTAARQELETLDLSTLDVGPGLSMLITVIARSRLGDGVANVGSIEATGRSLSTVWVSGDLGAIVAGDFERTPQTFASLWNDNLRRFDDNRDGRIDLGQNPDTREVLSDTEFNAFGRMDDDLNGRINFTEFRAYFMRGIDLDNNGTISTVELNAFIGGNPGEASVLIPRRGIDSLSVRSLGDTAKLPRSIAAAVDEVFRRYDVTANGQINLADPAEVKNEAQRNTFSRMDENSDTRITRQELTNHFGREVDTNSDNTLSTLELSGYDATDPESFGILFGKSVQRSSEIFGDVGRLEIRQHLIGTQLLIDGTLRDAFIGGSLLNVGEQLAVLAPTFNLARIVIGGSVEGRVTADRDLVWAQVNGSILGGAVDNAGNLGAGRDLRYARVNGDVVGQDAAGLSGVASGVVFANRNIGVASIGGSVQGGGGDFSGALLAEGKIQTAFVGRDLVGGAMAAPFSLSPGERAGVRAFGFVTHHTGLIRGRELVDVTIGRDIRAAANGLTGVQAVETIGTLTIGRDVIGQFDNHVAITAGGQPLTLARAAEDILKRYDKNKNGVIDLVQNIAKREVTTDDQLNTFARMDGDFNGVSLADLRDYLSRTVDGDGNGALSRNELINFQQFEPEITEVLFGVGGPSTPLADIAALILRRYDANRDNRIDLRQNIARKEVKEGAELETFGRMDGNFDGFVIAAEIVAFLALGADLDSDQHLIPGEADNFETSQPDHFSVLFTAPGIDLNPSSGLTDVAIGRLTIGRDLIRTDILAGYDVNLTGIDGDAQITSIVVGRDWIGSSASAGVQFSSIPAPAIVASSSPTALSDPSPLSAIEFSLPGIVSRIDLILIGRDLVDGPFSTVIAAQEVRRLQIGGSLTPLSAGPSNDDFSLTAGGLTRVIKAPRG